MRNRGPLRSVGPDLRGPLARDACPFCEDRLFDARQRPRLQSSSLVDREMSKSGALDLATGVGGKIKKEDVQSAVEQYNFFTPLMRMAWDVFVGSHASVSFLLPDTRHEKEHWVELH
ncbi:hypothetical protein BHE74_00058227 [Ensete ventricosum]|nr:hypothetical protein BHE74_00058227 [Ensete ventricosum]